MMQIGNIAAFGFVTRRDELLLVRRAYGLKDWALPGGTVEFGENIAAALSREILEEVSLQLPISDTGVMFAASYALQEYSVAFLFDIDGGAKEPSIRDFNEILEARFVHPSVALKLVRPINAQKLHCWLKWRDQGKRQPMSLIQC